MRKKGRFMTHSEQAYRLMLTEYPDLLTAQQVAGILGTTRQNIYKMIDDGALFGVKIGKSYKISKIRSDRLSDR
jgi:excisionase family DNA binding protein